MIDVRKRLVHALHSSATLPALREALIELACELEDIQGAPTLRSVCVTATDACGRNDEAPPTEPDSAPPTPVDSALGQEYGE